VNIVALDDHISQVNADAEPPAMRNPFRYFNSSPGQNTSGRKAARVVAVAAMIGQAMRTGSTYRHSRRQ
jgi:hypothetical protein